MENGNVRHRDVEVEIVEEDQYGKPTKEDGKKLNLHYSIDETPPWYLCVLLGFQHYLTMFGSTFSIPAILAQSLCLDGDLLGQAEILGTILFVSGLVTLLQSTLGTRLPIVQGGTFAFLSPTFAILALEKYQCPAIVPLPADYNDARANTSSASNITLDDTIYAGSAQHQEVWQIRMREIQGAIIAASVFQIAIGFSGAIGVMLRFIGPLVIAPTVTLIGISLFEDAASFASGNWWIALLTALLITLFSQYMRNITIPCCSFNTETKSCSKSSYHFFNLFPVILAILLAWGLCAILTTTDAIPVDHWASASRTDQKLGVLYEAKWFRFPYPGQWGAPTFSVASVFGMLAGVLAGMIESIGDYYAAARLSGAPPPPIHAINRGIFIEGIGCVLAGVWGSGSGTTSYSENVGAIGITKVGSRRVIQFASIIIMIFGVIGKFGALFITIPNPVIGGLFLVMFGMIAAVGVSNLQFVDLNSSRNLFIFGFSLFLGLCVPTWAKSNSGFVMSGSEILDQIIEVLLKTGMFVGGMTAFLLDNTVPGSMEERGILKWTEKVGIEAETAGDETYEISCLTKCLSACCSYVPICPTFKGSCGNSCGRRTFELEKNTA